MKVFRCGGSSGGDGCSGCFEFLSFELFLFLRAAATVNNFLSVISMGCGLWKWW